VAVVGTLKTFKGGHYFKKFEGTPSGPILNATLPSRVLLPLRQGFGVEVAPVVSVGDEVLAGQIVGRSDEKLSSPVLSSISGKVTEILEIDHPEDGKLTAAVVIESDGKDDWQTLKLPEGNFERWSSEDLSTVLYEAGITGMGKYGFPSALNSAEIELDKVQYLLINAIETEPYLEGSKVLLHEEFEKFVNGIKVLKGALGNIEVHVGLSYDHPHILEELENRLEYHDWLFLHPLLPKYPQGEDEVLLKSLIDVEVPAGEAPGVVGAVMANVEQVVAAYHAAIEGKPFIEKVVSIGGSSIGSPAIAKVRIGTMLNELLEQYGHARPSSVVLNGPMRGHEVDESATSVLRNTDAIVALKPAEQKLLGGLTPGFGLDSYTRIIPPVFGGPRRATTSLNGLEKPCIRCGYCIDICPQNLHPIWIAEAADRGDSAEMGKLDAFACIDCGLCSYVCPSKIPVMEKIQSGKQEIREELLQG